MEEQLISLKTAKLAKEKGFKISCHSYYFEDGEFRKHKIETTNGYYGDTVIYKQEEFYENWNSSFLTTKDGDRCFGCNKSQGYFETYSAPSQSLLQKWLRDVHGIYVSPYINSVKINKWDVEIYFLRYIIDRGPMENRLFQELCLESYEEALEFGLQEALKLI